jgi:hypothetical protein
LFINHEEPSLIAKKYQEHFYRKVRFRNRRSGLGIHFLRRFIVLRFFEVSSSPTPTASLSSSPSISPSAALPEYVGTWKGTNITAGSNIVDVTAILTSATYEFDRYLTGTTTQMDGSRGTHIGLTADTDCLLTQAGSFNF